MKKTMISLLPLVAAGLVGSAFAATEADVENTFFPYKKGVATLPGITPGMTITKSNLDQVKGALDPGTRMAIQNGWYDLIVGKAISFDPFSKYLEDTKKNLNKAKLGEKLGELVGYSGGLPFPEEPKANDPRAGEKLAWNFKLNYGAGDASQYSPFFYKFRNLNGDGKTERSIKFGYYVQKHKYRVNQSPAPEITPNPSNIFRSFYIRVSEPNDIKDTQLLIQRYADDTLRDDAYLYLGFQRRVRRLATNQTTDSFLGTDLMIEDFEGYNARVSDSTWNYKGTSTILLPMYNHNELKLSEEVESDGYRFVDSGGQGKCFINVTWQPRKVYIVEGTPVSPTNPVGKRVFYIDAQTFTMPQTLIYDRKGELWKIWTIGLSHPDSHLPMNRGTGVPLFDSFSMVDVQSKHCTVGLIRGQVHQPDQSLFSVQQMRGGTN